MVLDCEPKEVLDYIGHDGSTIRWPDLPEPLCRQGFTVEECIDCSLNAFLRYPVIFFDQVLYSEERMITNGYSPFDAVARMHKYIGVLDGVLLGVPKNTAYGHAMAWCIEERKVFDPTGFKAELDDYDLHAFIGIY